MMGPGGLLVTGRSSPAPARARAARGAVQVWSRDELAARVPALTPPADAIGLFEPRAGVLDPERAVSALLSSASARGADLRFDAAVAGFEVVDVGVMCDRGWRFEADRLVLAAGGWLTTLLPDRVAAPGRRARRAGLVSHRRRRAIRAGRCRSSCSRRPMAGCLRPAGPGPRPEARRAPQRRDTTADAIRREVSPAEPAKFLSSRRRSSRDSARRRRPPSASTPTRPTTTSSLTGIRSTTGCSWCSACSGHGFKFAPAIGELVADEIAGRAPFADLAPFRLCASPVYDLSANFSDSHSTFHFAPCTS